MFIIVILTCETFTQAFSFSLSGFLFGILSTFFFLLTSSSVVIWGKIPILSNASFVKIYCLWLEG